MRLDGRRGPRRVGGGDRCGPSPRVRGQASVEFALLAVSLAAALLLPWAGGSSPAEWLLGAVVAAARSFPAWLAVI